MTGRSERRPGDPIDHRASTDLTLAITSGQTSAISVFGRTGVRGRANVRSRDRPGSKQRAPAAGASTASAVIMAMSVQCAASLTETSRLRRCSTTDHTDRVHLVLLPTAEPRSRLNAVVDDHYTFCSCSLAVLDPRVGHTMDVLSPFIPVLCHSD